MTIWRLCKTRWVKTAFTGAGAAQNPGRWNSLGTRIVYCAETRALAAWEILAHVEDRADLAKATFSAIPVEVAEDLIQEVPPLPQDWRRSPPGESTSLVGDRFVETATHPVLKVPSAVVLGEFNYLINPAHPAFPSLKIGQAEAFRFDERVVSRRGI
jgi:RES domain-containing protein